MRVSPHLLKFTTYFVGSSGQLSQDLTRDPSLIWNTTFICASKGLVKKYRGGVGRSRRGVGHHVFSPSDGVGHAILSLG